MTIKISQETRDRYNTIAARTTKGIYVHQAACASKPPKVGDIVVDASKSWLVFLVHKVDGGYFWYGQDPQTVEGDPEEPCDEEFMKDISS